MPFSADSQVIPGAGLYRRLVGLTLVRIVLVTLLLAASAPLFLRRAQTELGIIEQTLYGVIIAAYVASLVYLLLLRRSARLHRELAYAQVCGDVFIAACLVYLTGGAESIVAFMFPITVVSAAVLLYRRGAVVAAVLSSLSFAAVVLGLDQGLLPPSSPFLQQVAMPAERLLFVLFANISAIFFTAALASYLAEQVRSTRERLTLREHDYLALELLHESIVRSITSGIVTADRFGRISFVNPAAERIVGVTHRAALGEPLEQHLPYLLGRFGNERQFERFEVEHTSAAGERRRLDCSVAPLLDREGKNHGFVVALDDLTSIRAMEEAIKQSERMAVIGSMAAGLAHELRNPLASMGGSIQLLSDSKLFSDEERRLMMIVLREADRLNSLVSDFLLFARPSPPQLEPLDLGEVIGSTVTLFRNDPTRKDIEAVARLDGELPISGDIGQLGQVLWNLLANAADAMPQGGRVHIEGCRRGDFVEIEIRDQGTGIAPEDLPHIFEPFFTTKEHGTGLGLATVHSIIQGHGGHIAVRSEAGRGASFSVKLPARGERQRITAARTG